MASLKVQSTETEGQELLASLFWYYSVVLLPGPYRRGAGGAAALGRNLPGGAYSPLKGLKFIDKSDFFHENSPFAPVTVLARYDPVCSMDGC